MSTESRIRTVVVPLDGSPLAERALPIAATIARRCGAQLVLIRVHEPPRLAIAYAYDWDAERRLGQASARGPRLDPARASTGTPRCLERGGRRVESIAAATSRDGDGVSVTRTNH